MTWSITTITPEMLAEFPAVGLDAPVDYPNSGGVFHIVTNVMKPL